MIMKRGEVYYIKNSDSWGSELTNGRPGVIVTSDEGCASESTVYQVVFLTTTPKRVKTAVKLATPRKQSWALCEQLFTVDQMRFGDYMCTLSEREMKEIDEALCLVLGLSCGNEEEIAGLKAEMAVKEDEILSFTAELKLYQDLYMKALDMLANLKLESDLKMKTSPVKVETLPKTEVVLDVVSEPEPVKPVERVELNGCSVRTLVDLGFSMTVARNIAELRPYNSVDELLLVPGVTKTAYELVKDKVYIEVKESEPVVLGKANVNTDTKEEIMRKSGMGAETARMIVAYRKKHGRFTSVEDLLNVQRFGKGCMRKFGDKLEV